MKEFLEEYGSIIVISIIGYAVMSGLWKILIQVSSVDFCIRCLLQEVSCIGWQSCFLTG